MQRRDFARLALMLPFAGSALAQDEWPHRPLKFILSQPAGSGPDILARAIGDQLSRRWSQPVVIDNRPGGQNVIGALAAARAPADGYTFYYATTAAMVTNVYTFKALPYDPAKDFVPVRLIGKSPFIVAVAADLPVNNLKELFALAKAKPGSLAIGTEGPKTFSGMLAGSMAATAGASFNLVPYTKATDALQDTMGGRVQVVCLPDAAVAAYVKSGKLKALAISTAQRQPQLPDLPTIGETLPGFEFTGWNGLFAPAGTPPAIVARVARDLDAVLGDPAVAQRLLELGTIAEPRMSVAEFGDFMVRERARWSDVVKVVGIEPE